VNALRNEIARLRETIQSQQTQLESLETRLNSYVQPPQSIAGPQASLPDKDPAPDTTPDAPSATPVALNGYFSSRFTRLPVPEALPNFEQQTVSFLVDKAAANWQFHSELEYEYGPDLTTFGGVTGAAQGHIGIEAGWLDYTYADLLRGRAGILLTPTYWALHHYPSIALTVENPLIHQRIFPANIVGAMVHGSHYFENGGFDYSVYAGNGSGFQDSQVQQDGRGAMGGTFLTHIPTGHFFTVFDAGFQFYRDKPAPGDRQQIYGFESHIEKGAFQFLGETAHANIGPQNGSRRLFREGYYLQPAWRLHKSIYAYYRYDWLKFDSRDSAHPFTDENTVGLNFRPIPTVSLKLEWNSSRPAGSLGPANQGFGTGVAFFFQ
jgi:hypothetical protein